MQLSDRQWNQIRAALKFWQAVAQESRVHPMSHRSVRGMFGDEKPTPLTDTEIGELLEKSPDPIGVVGWPIKRGVEHVFGAPSYTPALRDRTGRELERRGVSPVGVAGVARLYRWNDIVAAAETIRQRDRAFKEKYSAAR